MTTLWRLYRAQHGPGLDGVGGTFADGRWHSRGERVVYFGTSAAIVVLERLAHIDPDLLPPDLRLGRFEFSQTTSETKVEELSVLPARWTGEESMTRRLGARWRRERSSCLLVVPSAILMEETNCVLNPQHPEAESLSLVRERPFHFEPRLI